MKIHYYKRTLYEAMYYTQFWIGWHNQSWIPYDEEFWVYNFFCHRKTYILCIFLIKKLSYVNLEPISFGNLIILIGVEVLYVITIKAKQFLTKWSCCIIMAHFWIEETNNNWRWSPRGTIEKAFVSLEPHPSFFFLFLHDYF